ncbi:MAG TPA: prolyl oligopeptidase family serine peptidase [Pyrinomonadaceae bacterium]|nr:prolyl oligopeptidase family serine peptidase [Pyrinomonadaceae bacterium]HMP64367.1 prolyl oligopeptidase family serine peptidase [Pyrinomonadaceae bacterium]
MTIYRYSFHFYFLLFVSFLATAGKGQVPDRTEIIKVIQKEGCATIEDDRVKVCKFDYKFNGKNVEALTFRPTTEGRFPSVMMIPGYQGTAGTYFSFGTVFAKLGFATMTVSTPGFGTTEIEPDFLGERTINAFLEGFKKFEQEPYVDSQKMGLFGYSRGAIAASLMLPRLDRVKAAVLGGGIYDLKLAYNDITIEAIKANIEKETGLTDDALKMRSSIFQVNKISSAILIVHGDKDMNAPVNQAYLLYDRLKSLEKDVEFKLLEGQDHGIRAPDLFNLMTDFFSRKFTGKSAPIRSR